MAVVGRCLQVIAGLRPDRFVFQVQMCYKSRMLRMFRVVSMFLLLLGAANGQSPWLDLRGNGVLTWTNASPAGRFSLEWRAARLSSDRPMSARTALQMHYAAGVISVVMYLKQLHHHQGPLYGFSAQG